MNQRKRISLSIIVLLASAMFGVFMAAWGWEALNRSVTGAEKANALFDLDVRSVLRWSFCILMFLFGMVASSFLYKTPPYLFWLPPFFCVGAQTITFWVMDGLFVGWTILLMIVAFVVAFLGSLVPPLFGVAKNAILSRL